MDKSKKISLLVLIVVIGFSLGVIYHYILGNYLKMEDQFTSFLWPARDSFCDFKATLYYIQDFKPYDGKANFWVVYFPLSYVIMLFPFLFVKGWLNGYLFFVSIFLFFLFYANKKYLYCENLNKFQNIQNIFTLSLISYPVLYSLDKGNFDMVLFVLLGLSVFAFRAEKYKTSAVLLAVVNACKPFTLLFLLLFLMKKKYREFFLSIVLTGFLIVVGFLFFGFDILYQAKVLIDIWQTYKLAYAFSDIKEFGMAFGSSLFMPLKVFLCRLPEPPVLSTFLFTKIYDALCFLITAATLFFVWKEKAFWKQLALLTCNFILLPYITYDYKLIFLYIPMWFFISAKEKTKFDLIYIIIFGLLFIPKNIIINLVQTNPVIPKFFSLSIIINPILMLILTILIIYEQLKAKGHKENG